MSTVPAFTSTFTAASSSTTVSESTAEGTQSATVTTSADSAHPTPVTTFASSSQPATSLFGAFSAAPAVAASTVDSGDSGEPEVAPEEESTAQYTPLVKLNEVEVKTGEEDDDVLYSQRSALYRFDSGAGEWKERGKGDVKLLQNKSSKKIRILLRQEKTLKICCNHIVHPDLVLKPNAGSDRSWTWRTTDYAGDEPNVETFAIRFKDAEIANQYKAKWDSAREANAKTLKGETA